MSNKKTYILKQGGDIMGVFGNVKAAYETAFCITPVADRVLLVRYQQAVDGLRDNDFVDLSDYKDDEDCSIQLQWLQTKCAYDFETEQAASLAHNELLQKESLAKKLAKQAKECEGTFLSSL